MITSKHYVLLISLISFFSQSFASTELQNVQIRNFTTSQLTRLPEYFTGKEFTGRRIFCRSSAERDGLYFSFPLSKELSRLSSDSIINLSIIRSDSNSTEEYFFKLPKECKGKKDLFIGLTGKDSPSNHKNLIAWQIKISNSSRKLLFWKKSFLWDHD